MAGMGVLALKAYHNVSYFNKFSKISSPKHENSENESDYSSSSRLSLQSKESSIDITPNEDFVKILYLKQHQVRLLSKQQKFLDTLSCLFSMVGLLLCLVSSEISRSQEALINSIYTIVLVSTALLLICISYSSYLSYSIVREKKLGIKEGCDDTYTGSQEFYILILDIILCSIQPLPFLNPSFEFHQLNGVLTISLHDILTSFMLLRVIQLLKLLRHYSKWTNEKSTAICDSFAATANISYALRALLREKPIQLMVPVFAISTLVLSLGVRIYENNFNSLSGGQDYSYLWNSIWLVLLTMTTVGYGDFYPKTHIGRFIIVISAFWGIFIVSLIILILTNSSSFSSAQSRAYNFMKKIELRQKGNRYAGIYLNSIIELFLLSRKSKSDKRFKEKKYEILVKTKTFFRRFKYYKKLSQQIEKSPEEMLRVINETLACEIIKLEEIIRVARDLEEQLKTLRESQNKSIEYLSETKACMKKLLKDMIISQEIE